MELNERIEALLKYSKKNISDFSRFVGFKTPQAVRELIKGNTKSLSDDAKTKLLVAFPHLNEDWLVSGNGQMLKDSPTKPMIDVKNVEDSFNDSSVLNKFLEIIKDKDKQIEELNTRISILTDKLLGI